MFEINNIDIGEDNVLSVSIQAFSIDPETQGKTFSGKVYTASLNKDKFAKTPQAAIDAAKAKFKQEILADRQKQQEIDNTLSVIRGLITPEDFETYL